MLPFRWVSYGVLIALGITLSGEVSAQQPIQPLVVKQLAPDVYWTQGGAGGNTGIIIGATSLIVIDAKMTAESAQAMLAAIAKLTDKPVTHVILTHSDSDHVNGLAGFPDGLRIIAHENAKKEMEAAIPPGARGGLPLDRLPNQVVTRTGATLTIDGVKIELHHWAPAHTSGDLVVYLPDKKIVFTGDIVTTPRPDPLIHLEKNGSSEGWITTTKGILGLSANQFVPGHGDLQTRAQIEARLTATEDKRATIVAMVNDGKPLAEIKKAVGDPSAVPAAPAARAGRGQAAAAPATYTDVVYQELTKR